MVTICFRHRVIQRFILSSILTSIDLWLNTQLVHDLYLKRMEGHLPMIDCEKLSCKISFHCVRSTRFIHEHFSFHSKWFPFSQDMAITIRSGGIKLEYALFKFLHSSILLLYYLFPGCYSFRSVYALFPAPCVISENQKQIGKCAYSM
jgi:hypothetical protein